MPTLPYLWPELIALAQELQPPEIRDLIYKKLAEKDPECVVGSPAIGSMVFWGSIFQAAM